MKRFALIVVAVTLGILIWVPARGERSSRGSGGQGGGGVAKLRDPRPYVFDLCVGDFKKREQSCILPGGGKYRLWAGDLGAWNMVFKWKCERRDGKGNDDSQYPCIYDLGPARNSGRFYMYLGDIK